MQLCNGLADAEAEALLVIQTPVSHTRAVFVWERDEAGKRRQRVRERERERERAPIGTDINQALARWKEMHTSWKLANWLSLGS